MKCPTILAVLAIVAGVAAAPAFITSAEAQVPPRNGAWGDRDRDGIPNAFDRHDNRQLRDKDHDGVPQAWDRNDHKPYRH